MPENPNARIAEGIPIEMDETIVFDFGSVPLTLDVLQDGGPFQGAANDYGEIWIVDRHSGAEIEVGDTFFSPFSVDLVPGVYDVVYRLRQGGFAVPANPNHVLRRDLVVAAGMTELIDVITHEVDPVASLNGGLFPDDGSGHGEFFLHDPDGNAVLLGRTDQAFSATRVIEGAYSVHYEWRDGTGVPRNDSHLLDLVAVPEPATGWMLPVLAGALAAVSRRQGDARGRLSGCICEEDR